MSQPDEINRLLPEARAGSRKALGQVLQACRRYLLWIAQREFDPDLLPKAGASDIVQDTLLDAHRDFATFRGETEAELLAWMRTLLLHNLSNFARGYRDTAKRRLASERSLEAMGDLDDPDKGLKARSRTPSQIISAKEQTEVIEKAMLRLPDDYCQVIQLWYREEKSFEEIGEVMSRSPNAARMLWVRAIEKLQQELEAMSKESAG